ncbi:MAG: DNA/RNA non-specific endonuclease [Oricola sp.]
MHPIVESILKDKEVLRELKERDLLREAAEQRDQFAPYVEGVAPAEAAARDAGIEESLERLSRGATDFDQIGMAEAIIIREGYPSLLVQDGTYTQPRLQVWRDRLDPFRGAIDHAIGSVARVELTGHPQYNWVGTGWLIDDDVIVTNRHVARIFADPFTRYSTFRANVSATVDFYEEYERDRELLAAVREIIHVETRAGVDMALVRLDRQAASNLKLAPIAIADRMRDDATIGVIGYPAFDPRNDPDDMAQIFEDIYNKKRFAPGQVMDRSPSPTTFTHNCTTLGGNSGSVVIDVESGCAVGLHFGGRQGERNHAVNAAAIRDVAARHRVSVRTAAPAGTGGAAAGGGSGELPVESAESLAGRTGYDPLFLGEGELAPVPLPALNALQMRQAARLPDGSAELKYMHFSLAMNAARRLAFFTAVNIDGTDLWHKRRGRDPWRTDPRIPEDAQVDNALYRSNDFDRGHLVRRLDPVWGPKEDAKTAEADTFHYTNAAPQHKDLNQKIWLDLENHVLEKTGERDARISVFAGPVFGSSDPRSKRSGLEEVGIPLGFWKVIVSIGRTRRGRRELQAQAFVMWQWDMFRDPDLELVFGRQFETYQLAVTDLERLTGLDFSERVRDADTFEKAPEPGPDTEAAAAGGRVGPKLQREAIRSFEDII